MLLGTFVLCFFAFCWFVIIKSYMKPKEIDNAPSCAVEPELSKLEKGLQREVQNSLNGKSFSKRNSKDSVPMIKHED